MHEQSIANSVLVIRPMRFGANAETTPSNLFQKSVANNDLVAKRAQAEFDNAIAVLRAAGIRVEAFDDTPEPEMPDAVFPNNWVSFHEDGTVCLYPMQAQNRRYERRRDILDALLRERGYRLTEVVDWSHFENDGRFLEGTGSLVLDRAHRIAYACISPRTDPELVRDWCRVFGYEPVLFHAMDAGGVAIYHTNVMMCVGDRFAVICLEAIADPGEREGVATRLQATGHRLIPISFAQMAQFAGNMLLLQNTRGERILAMSSRAEHSLTDAQCDDLQTFARFVSSPLATIEDCAGGSMRCMMAELFLPRQ